MLLSSRQAKSQPGHTESLTTLAFVLVWKWTFLGRRCQPEFMAPHLPWALSHFYGSLESSHLCAQVTTLSFQLCHQGSCSALSVSDLAATSSHQVHCLSNSPSFYEHLHLHSRLHLQSQRHGHLSVLFLLCLYDHWQTLIVIPSFIFVKSLPSPLKLLHIQEADFILLGFTLVHFTDNHIFTNERSVTTWQPASLWAPFPQQLLLTSCLWVTCWQFSKYFKCFHSQYPSLVGHVFL